MSLLPFRGVCPTCRHDHDADTEKLHEIVERLVKTPSEPNTLLRQALEALEYHRAQTRPIARTDDVMVAIREHLMRSTVMCGQVNDGRTCMVERYPSQRLCPDCNPRKPA